MATDFTYNNKTINSSGGFKPSGKDMPIDARTRVNTFADIATIPTPYVGMIITVLQDETNNGKMTDYKIKSLKANSLGSANSLVDKVVRYVDYLGAGSVSQDDINTAVNNYFRDNPVTGGATTEQANQIEANKTNIATLKELVGDSSSGLVKAVTDNTLQLEDKANKNEISNLQTQINNLVLGAVGDAIMQKSYKQEEILKY